LHATGNTTQYFLRGNTRSDRHDAWPSVTLTKNNMSAPKDEAAWAVNRF
jgi:hypothetical protein